MSLSSPDDEGYHRSRGKRERVLRTLPLLGCDLDKKCFCRYYVVVLCVLCSPQKSILCSLLGPRASAIIVAITVWSPQVTTSGADELLLSSLSLEIEDDCCLDFQPNSTYDRDYETIKTANYSFKENLLLVKMFCLFVFPSSSCLMAAISLSPSLFLFHYRLLLLTLSSLSCYSCCGTAAPYCPQFSASCVHQCQPPLPSLPSPPLLSFFFSFSLSPCVTLGVQPVTASYWESSVESLHSHRRYLS